MIFLFEFNSTSLLLKGHRNRGAKLFFQMSGDKVEILNNLKAHYANIWSLPIRMLLVIAKAYIAMTYKCTLLSKVLTNASTSYENPLRLSFKSTR